MVKWIPKRMHEKCEEKCINALIYSLKWLVLKFIQSYLENPRIVDIRTMKRPYLKKGMICFPLFQRILSHFEAKLCTVKHFTVQFHARWKSLVNYWKLMSSLLMFEENWKLMPLQLAFIGLSGFPTPQPCH